MKFTKAVDIWALSEAEIAKLQPGQWVFAGDVNSKGRFYGQGRSTVVAWQGNARNRYRSYQAFMAQYGRTVRAAAEVMKGF